MTRSDHPNGGHVFTLFQGHLRKKPKFGSRTEEPGGSYFIPQQKTQAQLMNSEMIRNEVGELQSLYVNPQKLTI